MLVGELRKRKIQPADATPQEPKASLLRALLVLPQDYGVLCLAFFLFFSRDAFVAVYTFLFAGNALLLGGSLLLWYREFTTYDRETRLAAATKEGNS
jgi:hypothetical protein